MQPHPSLLCSLPVHPKLSACNMHDFPVSRSTSFRCGPSDSCLVQACWQLCVIKTHLFWCLLPLPSTHQMRLLYEVVNQRRCRGFTAVLSKACSKCVSSVYVSLSLCASRSSTSVCRPAGKDVYLQYATACFCACTCKSTSTVHMHVNTR